MRFLSFDDNFQIDVVTAGNLNPELIDRTYLYYNIHSRYTKRYYSRRIDLLAYENIFENNLKFIELFGYDNVDSIWVVMDRKQRQSSKSFSKPFIHYT